MNLENLVNPVQKRELTSHFKSFPTFGNTIGFVGGETEIVEELVPENFSLEVIKRMIPVSTASKKEIEAFEKSLENIPTEILEEVRKELSKDIKSIRGIKHLKKEMEKYPTLENKVHFDELEEVYDLKSMMGKENCLRFIIRRRRPMMRRRKSSSEVKKGENMKVEIFDKTNEFTFNIDGKKVIKFVPDKGFKRRCDTPEYNEGELKNKDIVTLFLSGRIGTLEKVKEDGKEKTIFVPLRDKTDVYNENEIIPGVRSMAKHNLIYVQIRDEAVLLRALKRKTYSLNDTSKEEISFILNLKGDALKASECSYYNKELEDNPERANNWVNLKALGYNMLDYDKNHAVVIAKEPTLQHLENRIKKLHKEFYDFESKDGEQVTGLYGLTRSEESFQKAKEYRNGFDFSEIEELFEIFEERNADGKLRIKGNQSIRNIEYDIRNHERARYILSKSSDELFFLKVALEDALHDSITADCWVYDNFKDYGPEVKEALNRNKRSKITSKKLQALINVVSGLHLEYEEREDMGKYLTDELDQTEKVEHQRSDKYYKTSKNLYSQTRGVLTPNGDPQTTHKRKSNPPSMENLRLMRRKNRNVIVGRYAGVSDPKVLVGIYDGLEVPPSYPYSFQQKLGVKGVSQSKKVIDATFEELKFWLPSSTRKEYWALQEELYPTPQFRVPTFKVEKFNPLKVCNRCKHEWECFLEKLNRYNELKEEKRRLRIKEEKDRLFELQLNKYDWKYCRVLLETALKIPVKEFYTSKDLKISWDYPQEKLTRQDVLELIKERKDSLTKDELLALQKHLVFETLTYGVKIDQEKVNAIRARKREGKPSPSTFSPGYNYFKQRSEKPKKEIKYGKIGENLHRIKLEIDGKEVPVYAKGNLDVLTYPSVSIAGIRTPSEETVGFVSKTVTNLAEEYVIVSGLAEGCDTIAHKSALNEGTFTIAVLPCGFNNIYPPENKDLAQEILDDGGLLISEYEPDKKVNTSNLVNRNKIIAGLSDTVIICEAGNGTKHTARFAEEQNKNILVQHINTFNNNSMVELGIGKWYQRDGVI